MTDKELLKEYLNGNMNAFHTFYENHKDFLYTFLKNRSEEKAADLFQETFIRFIDALTKRKLINPNSFRRLRKARSPKTFGRFIPLR